MKQEFEIVRAAFYTAIGVGMLSLDHAGCIDVPGLLLYPLAGALLIVPWLFYRHKWKENSEEFLPPDGSNATDGGILQEWELNYIGTQAERGACGQRSRRKDKPFRVMQME